MGAAVDAQSRAAVARRAELGGIGRFLWFVRAGFESRDYHVEVVRDLLIHLDQASMSSCLCGADDLVDFRALLPVLGQEIGVVMNIGQVRQAFACGQFFAPAGGRTRSGEPG